MRTTNAIATHYSAEEQTILARFATRPRRAGHRGVRSLNHDTVQVLAVL
jgi:hypothetical protein